MTTLRIGPVVALSLTAGFITAAVLVLGPFGGAVEHVITGVTLLAFALGWALLAGLSIRFTDQPQRWAVAPAATLGCLGAGLLVAAPGVRALDALCWVWPPVLLLLAVRMAMGARGQLSSRARLWFAYPVIFLYGLAALGGLAQTVQDFRERREYQGMAGTIEVSGRRMFISCEGWGRPTVVLESGLGETSAYWGWIKPRVAAFARVCVYDRAGRGRSDEASSPRDGIGVVSDLHALLAQVPGPFVLVGHSSGAQYVRIYAGRYPAEVAGVVLIDPQPAEAMTRLPIFPAFYRVFRRASALFPPLARMGVARLLAMVAPDGLPHRARQLRRVHAASPHSARSLRDEFAQLPTALHQAGAVRSFGDLPLVIVTAARDAQEGWLPLQKEMAGLSRNSVHRVLEDATHSSLIEDEHDSLAATEAIREVVDAVRTGRPLSSPGTPAALPALTSTPAAPPAIKANMDRDEALSSAYEEPEAGLR